MTFVIQNYIPTPGSPIGADAQTGFALDTETDPARIFTRSDTGASTDGLRTFDVATAIENGTATLAEFMGAGYPSFEMGIFCRTPLGQIVAMVKGFFGDGSAALALIDFELKLLIESMNLTGPPADDAIPTPQSLSSTIVRGKCFVAADENATIGKSVHILSAGPSDLDFICHTFDVNEAQAWSCGTPEQGSGLTTFGLFYTLGRGPNASEANPACIYKTTVLPGAEAYPSSLYPAPNPKITTTPQGTFSPPDIDPQWATWTAVTGPGFDRSDGNLIVGAASQDVGIDNPFKIAKISATDGSVIWSTPVIDIPSAHGLRESIIDGGVFKLLIASTLYVFDTETGVMLFQENLGGSVTAFDSVDDYWSNSIYFFGINGGPQRWNRVIYGATRNPCDDFASDGCAINPVPCVTSWTQCWRIERKDGVVLRFTALDRNLTFNGEEYESCGSLSPSAAESSTSVGSIQNVEAQGIITSDLITEADLYGGKYDDAFVDVWIVPWAVDALGVVSQSDEESPRRLASGWIGTVTHDDNQHKAEVLGGGARLSQQAILETYTPSCRWKIFGGTECTVDIDQFKRDCAVIIATNRAVITADIGAESGSSGVDDGGVQWENGKAIWRTGRNAGEICEVKTVDFDSGEVVFWALPPYLPEAGDEFDLFPGCDRLAATCKDVYNNYLNFGGFPDVPGDDSIREAPDAKY